MWLLFLGPFRGDDEGGGRGTGNSMESEPLFWPARYHLGELRREQGRILEAVSEFKKVLEQDPRNSTTLRCLARAYLDAGNLPKARQTLARMRPQDAQNFRARMVRAQLHAVEGKGALALKQMDEEE